jgi:hypothetical protein
MNYSNLNQISNFIKNNNSFSDFNNVNNLLFNLNYTKLKLNTNKISNSYQIGGVNENGVNADELNPDGLNPDGVNADRLNPDEFNPDEVNADELNPKILNQEGLNNQLINQQIGIQTLPDTYLQNPGYTSDYVNTYTIKEGTILYHATTNKKGFNTANKEAVFYRIDSSYHMKYACLNCKTSWSI